MATKTIAADKTANSKPKSNKKSEHADTIAASAIEVAVRASDDHIRERAYGIWLAEGRPHGREQAHWRRASLELQGEPL